MRLSIDQVKTLSIFIYINMEGIMVFYLSSTGHAATTWIADTFSLHPEVTTYHGTRTIPAKAAEDYEDMSQLPSGYCPKVAKRLTDGLVSLERRDGNVYGAIHTICCRYLRRH